MKLYTLPIFIILFSISLSACSKEEKYFKSEGMIWNTVYHITYKGPSELQDSILPVLNEVGKSLSVFDSNSLVSKLNREDSVKADSYLITVYDASRRINSLSGGRFDPTVSPLVDAWGFGIGHTPSIDTIAVDSILTFIGIQKTHRNGEYIVKDDIRTRFNFSAIAKGYGCDAVGEMLQRNGVNDYMVEIGGEISLKGKSPSGTSWRIAVDTPKEGNNPGEDTALILSLTDVGIATSGNYRNYREEGNKKVGHTISPITGQPFLSEILSATIIAPTCMEADALATACMAGTSQEAIDLIEASGAEGLLIYQDSLWMSPGFSKFVDSKK